MGFLKTLLFFAVIYYGFKFLLRLFAPFLVKKAADTMQRKAQQHSNQTKQNPNIKEGETIIDKAPRRKPESRNDVGEYVDYEEVD